MKRAFLISAVVGIGIGVTAGLAATGALQSQRARFASQFPNGLPDPIMPDDWYPLNWSAPDTSIQPGARAKDRYIPVEWPKGSGRVVMAYQMAPQPHSANELVEMQRDWSRIRQQYLILSR